MLNEYPECTGSFAARAKAIAGISIGALAFLLWFIGIIANMSR
jgi:hypothetical protein